MRILQIIEFFTPAKGGPVQVAYQISKNLAARGHDVSLWTSDYGLSRGAYADAPFRVVLHTSIFSKWNFYVTPSILRAAKQELSTYDIIHMHDLRTFQNAAVAGRARRWQIPYVVSAHGSLPVIVERQTAKKAFDGLFGNRLIDGAAKLIAVSPVEVDQYVAAGISPSKVTLIPNGLDLEEFAQLPARGLFRKKFGIPENGKVVLFLGRLHRIKGIDHLIRAFFRLQHVMPDIILVILGPDDGDEDRLQSMVTEFDLRNQVRFAGPVYGADKLEALVDADVVASPSQYEIFGLVPFEALMCGTPVVVTNDCGSGQLIEKAGAGYMVPYGDVTALTEALLEALQNTERSARLVHSGQAFVRSELQWSGIVQRLEQTYATVFLHETSAVRPVSSGVHTDRKVESP